MIGNALAKGCPIIYCNTSFCELTQYERYELVQKSCVCDFLYGPDTDGNAITQIENALSESEEKHIETYYYRKDGKIYLVQINDQSYMCGKVSLQSQHRKAKISAVESNI